MIAKRLFSAKAKQVLANAIRKTQAVEQRPATLSTFNHGYYRKDDYAEIRYDQAWQKRIIKREDAINAKWREKMMYHTAEWKKYLYKRSDPGPDNETLPEAMGTYLYYSKQKEFPREKTDVGGAVQYDYFLRKPREPASAIEAVTEE